MDLKAYNNFVIVKLDDIDKVIDHASGIALAPTDHPCTGVVTSVGPACKGSWAEGDKVLVPPQGAQEYRIETDIYFILLEYDIYGKVNAKV